MTIKKMVSILAKKLTEDEFLALQDLMDADPPAGPFWEAVTDQARKMRPDLFVQPAPID